MDACRRPDWPYRDCHPTCPRYVFAGIRPCGQVAPAPEWVRELRKNHRDLQKKNRELEEKLRANVEPVKTVDLGRKPTLEDSDYDADDFEQKLSGWYERKRQVDEMAAKAEADQRPGLG